jgi:transposase, IS6 family
LEKLLRAVDKFMLSDRRNTNAAYRFLRKAIKAMSQFPPSSIATDKLALYLKAIRRLQNEGLLPKEVEHWTSKYLTNILEAGHGAQARDPADARLSDDENRRRDPERL